MPNGISHGIAQGLSTGVDNFLNAYLSVKNMQNQEKYRKLQPQLDLVHTIINNPDIPLEDQIKAVNQLPYILDPKHKPAPGELPLADQMGLTHLASQQIQTSPSQDEQLPSNPTRTTPEGNIDLNAGPSIEGKKAIPAKYKTRGQMSHNEIQNLQAENLIQKRQDAEFARQKELMVTQAELAKSNLKATGFNKTIEHQATKDGVMTDSDGTKVEYKQGDYLVTGVNSAMENKTINLKDTKSIKEVVATQTKNKPSAVLANLEAGYLTKVNPATGQVYTEEEANAAAAKDFADHFQASTDYLKGGGKERDQRTTGTTPPTPAQVIGQNKSDQATQLAIRKDVDEAAAKETSALQVRESIATRRKAASETAMEADKTVANLEQIEDPDNQQKEQLRVARADAKTKRIEYNNLSTKYEDAHKDYVTASGLKMAAQNRLNELSGQGSDASVAKYAGQISNFRTKNKGKKLSDGTLVDNATDMQIYLEAKSHGLIK